MPFAQLTRKVRFAAAHRYYRTEWTEAENRRVFGSCANPHGHGHNYLMEVTVSAEINNATGFSADLPVLDEILERTIVRVFDHQHINHAVPEFGAGQLIPTCENLTRYAWQHIAPELPAGVSLERIRLHEDETFYVDYFGDD